MPAIRGTQINDAVIKLDGLRAQHTINGAIGKLWQHPHRERRTSRVRRLSAFQAYLEEHIKRYPDYDDARSDLSPTPSPRASPPPTFHPATHSNHNRRRRRKEDTQQQRYWSWERQDSIPQSTTTSQKVKKQRRHHQKASTMDENAHTMVTRSRTSRRTRFYKLKVPP